MKRIFLALLVSVSAILMSGCSTVEYFMIVNESDAPLEIVLKWKDGLKGPLRKHSYVGFNGRKFDRLEPLDDMKAGDKNEIRIMLDPKQAISVHSIYQWPREAIRRLVDSDYRVYQIDLKGAKGEMHLSGEQAWFQFREMDQGYFLIYR